LSFRAGASDLDAVAKEQAVTLRDKATGAVNPIFVPKFKPLNVLLTCQLDGERDEVAALLNYPDENDKNATAVADDHVNKLITFLGGHDIVTFQQVGGLSDNVVTGMEQLVPDDVSPGTYSHFRNLHNIFHQLWRQLQQQQGKVDWMYSIHCLHLQ
jgi:hypothetical protein